MERKLDSEEIEAVSGQTYWVPGLIWKHLVTSSSRQGTTKCLIYLCLNEEMQDETAWALVSLLHWVTLVQTKIRVDPRLLHYTSRQVLNLWQGTEGNFTHCKEILLHKASVTHRLLKPMDLQLVVFSQSNLWGERERDTLFTTQVKRTIHILANYSYSLITEKGKTSKNRVN